jgi:hypothetical protein
MQGLPFALQFLQADLPAAERERSFSRSFELAQIFRQFGKTLREQPRPGFHLCEKAHASKYADAGEKGGEYTQCEQPVFIPEGDNDHDGNQDDSKSGEKEGNRSAKKELCQPLDFFLEFDGQQLRTRPDNLQACRKQPLQGTKQSAIPWHFMHKV